LREPKPTPRPPRLRPQAAALLWAAAGVRLVPHGGITAPHSSDATAPVVRCLVAEAGLAPGDPGDATAASEAGLRPSPMLGPSLVLEPAGPGAAAPDRDALWALAAWSEAGELPPGWGSGGGQHGVFASSGRVAPDLAGSLLLHEAAADLGHAGSLAEIALRAAHGMPRARRARPGGVSASRSASADLPGGLCAEWPALPAAWMDGTASALSSPSSSSATSLPSTRAWVLPIRLENATWSGSRTVENVRQWERWARLAATTPWNAVGKDPSPAIFAAAERAGDWPGALAPAPPAMPDPRRAAPAVAAALRAVASASGSAGGAPGSPEAALASAWRAALAAEEAPAGGAPGASCATALAQALAAGAAQLSAEEVAVHGAGRQGQERKPRVWSGPVASWPGKAGFSPSADSALGHHPSEAMHGHGYGHATHGDPGGWGAPPAPAFRGGIGARTDPPPAALRADVAAQAAVVSTRRTSLSSGIVSAWAAIAQALGATKMKGTGMASPVPAPELGLGSVAAHWRFQAHGQGMAHSVSRSMEHGHTELGGTRDQEIAAGAARAVLREMERAADTARETASVGPYDSGSGSGRWGAGWRGPAGWRVLGKLRADGRLAAGSVTGSMGNEIGVVDAVAAPASAVSPPLPSVVPDEDAAPLAQLLARAGEGHVGPWSLYLGRAAAEGREGWAAPRALSWIARWLVGMSRSQGGSSDMHSATGSGDDGADVAAASRAWRYFEEAARAGSGEAAAQLGRMAASGLGPGGFGMGMDEKNADLSHPLLSHAQRGSRPDWPRATQWLAEADRRGHPAGAFGLAALVLTGRTGDDVVSGGVVTNKARAKALALAERSGAQGEHPPLPRFLGGDAMASRWKGGQPPLGLAEEARFRQLDALWAWPAPRLPSASAHLERPAPPGSADGHFLAALLIGGTDAETGALLHLTGAVSRKRRDEQREFLDRAADRGHLLATWHRSAWSADGAARDGEVFSGGAGGPTCAEAVRDALWASRSGPGARSASIAAASTVARAAGLVPPPPGRSEWDVEGSVEAALLAFLRVADGTGCPAATRDAATVARGLAAASALQENATDPREVVLGAIMHLGDVLRSASGKSLCSLGDALDRLAAWMDNFSASEHLGWSLTPTALQAAFYDELAWVNNGFATRIAAVARVLKEAGKLVDLESPSSALPQSSAPSSISSMVTEGYRLAADALDARAARLGGGASAVRLGRTLIADSRNPHRAATGRALLEATTLRADLDEFVRADAAFEVAILTQFGEPGDFATADLGTSRAWLDHAASFRDQRHGSLPSLVLHVSATVQRLLAGGAVPLTPPAARTTATVWSALGSPWPDIPPPWVPRRAISPLAMLDKICHRATRPLVQWVAQVSARAGHASLALIRAALDWAVTLGFGRGPAAVTVASAIASAPWVDSVVAWFVQTVTSPVAAEREWWGGAPPNWLPPPPPPPAPSSAAVKGPAAEAGETPLAARLVWAYLRSLGRLGSAFLSLLSTLLAANDSVLAVAVCSSALLLVTVCLLAMRGARRELQDPEGPEAAWRRGAQ